MWGPTLEEIIGVMIHGVEGEVVTTTDVEGKEVDTNTMLLVDLKSIVFP